ncbi:hypothetical protein AALO_G00062590 [Alosa alosa]|uniref:Trans-sialidase n=1 Tax=Alosa alosa TaxID=278164 RepID=A0AAV6H051_9TELE|nr:hypothetical protein AALO_G00062590 [Alosa alosa]
MQSHTWGRRVATTTTTTLHPPSISALCSGEASNRREAAGKATRLASSMWATLLVGLLVLCSRDGAAKNASEISPGEELVIAKGKLMAPSVVG